MENYKKHSGCVDGKTHRRWKLFRKSQDGVAAIEFAICAPVFFMMTFGIFEVGLNYTADRMLSASLDSAARLVRTGQARASDSYGVAQFRQDMCNQPTMFLFDCSKLQIDVRMVAAFDETDWETDEDGEVQTDEFGFAPGGPTTINVARVYYEWPTILLDWTRFGQTLGYQVDQYEDNVSVMMASTAFLTEPFGSGSGTGG